MSYQDEMDYLVSNEEKKSFYSTNLVSSFER